MKKDKQSFSVKKDVPDVVPQGSVLRVSYIQFISMTFIKIKQKQWNDRKSEIKTKHWKG